MSVNYRDRYYVMKSSEGEKIIVDTWDISRRYRKMARGFVNCTQFEGFTYYQHFTLTQTVESFKPRILNKFLMALKKRYGKIHYIWCIEVQEERKLKYGDSVLHWHLVVAFEPDTVFTKEDILKIQSYWEYGNVDIKPVRKLNLNYIMKYITKTLNSPLEELYKMRKIGMSRIGQVFRYSKERLADLIKHFSFDLEHLKWFKANSRGIFYRYRDAFGGWSKDFIFTFPRWNIIDTISGFEPEPF